jgi:hypothetical protein
MIWNHWGCGAMLPCRIIWCMGLTVLCIPFFSARPWSSPESPLCPKDGQLVHIVIGLSTTNIYPSSVVWKKTSYIVFVKKIIVCPKYCLGIKSRLASFSSNVTKLLLFATSSLLSHSSPVPFYWFDETYFARTWLIEVVYVINNNFG